MQVGSVLEVYTTMYGWEAYGTLADLFSTTGLMWAPVLAIIYRNWKGPVTSQDNKAASATSLSRMQFDLYAMVIVIILAFYPLIPLTVTDINYTQVCTDESGSQTEDTINISDTTYHDVTTNTKVPIFWHLAMSIGSGINYHMIGNLKCFEDIPWIDEKIRNIIITDEDTSKEYSRFVNDCYVPAKNKYENAMAGKQYARYVSDELDAGRPVGILGGLIGVDYDKKDPHFIGSHFYLETPGFYKPADNTAIQGFGFRAAKPVEGWMYDSTRDKSYTPDMLTADDPGSPYCSEWWNHPSIGLKKKLLDSADTINSEDTGGTLSFYEKVIGKIKSVYTDASDELVADLILKGLQRNNDWDFTGTGDYLGRSDENITGSNFARTAGGVIGGFFASAKVAGHYTEMHTVKHAAPMAQAILLLVIYMLLSVIMVISCYDLKVLFTAFFLVIATKFFTIIWALSIYLDSSLFTAIYPDAGVLGSIDSLDFKRLILDMILTGMIVIAPLLLTAILALAGYNFGRVAEAFGKSMSGPQSTGKSAGEEPTNHIKKKITR